MITTIAVEAQWRASSCTTAAAARGPSPMPPTSGELVRPSRPARPRASRAALGYTPSRSTVAAAGATTSATTASRATRYGGRGSVGASDDAAGVSAGADDMVGELLLVGVAGAGHEDASRGSPPGHPEELS